MNDPLHISLLPAHPSEGSASMLRYWKRLALEAIKTAEVVYDCPYKWALLPVKHTTKYERAFFKYCLSPMASIYSVPSSLVHLTDHSMAHLIPYISKSKKVVVTVHDLLPLLTPVNLSGSQIDRYRRCVKNLSAADRLICVSEYTRQQAHDLLDIPFEMMAVIPEGATEFVFCKEQNTVRHADNMIRILSVGSTLPRKNLKIIPDVAAVLLAGGYKVELWRVGVPIGSELRGRFNRLDPSCFRLKEWGLVPDDVLLSCYRDADCIIMPSYQEGFGLPVLEAMAAGCPVVSSNATALPEVGGDAALYFDPDDFSSAARLIMEIKLKPEFRMNLISKGNERCRLLTWKNHFNGVKSVYEELLSR